MSKFIFILVFLVSLPHLVCAGTLKDERRIEEEARQKLRPTEDRPKVTQQPSAANQPSSAGWSQSQLLYFQEIMAKKYVLRSDALRSLLMLISQDNSALDQAGQIKLLKERSIIPPKIASAFASEKPLRKGLAAEMFCRALGIKGGLTLRLFGMNQRYAFNELVFLRIMPQGSQDDIISGREFIALFTKAVEYLSAKIETAQKRVPIHPIGLGTAQQKKGK
jgi:hypothetical protein